MQTEIISSSSTQANASVTQLGGKGKNLLTLKLAGFQVPYFIVLPVAFFEELMGADLPVLDGLCLAAANSAGAERDAAMAAARQLILHKKIDANTEQEILRLLAGQGEHFAVRSSAVDEDASTHSFAGQLDSFLFVPADASIFGKILACYASAYNDRSFAYRSEHALTRDCIRPAVVVQSMVFADVSGLVFTGNPMNCNPDEMVISASYGAGEGVVSGEMDCDTWYIDESGAVARKVIVEKAEGLFFDEEQGHGLKRKNLDAAIAHMDCLTEAQVRQLTQIAHHIELAYCGIPQDIEWGFVKDQLYILQARPVSNLSHICKFSARTILDNSNIVESFSGVTSPLTFSFASRVYEKVYEQFYGLFGVPASEIQSLKPVFRNMLAYYQGHVYYNLNSWYRSLSLLPFFDTNKKNFDASIGVQARSGTAGLAHTMPRGRLASGWRAVTAGVRMTYFYLRRHRICRRFASDFDVFMQPYMQLDMSGLNNVELLATYDRVEQRLLNDWRAPIINDFFAETFHGLLRLFLKRYICQDEQQISLLHNDLLCGQGGMASVAPTNMLMDIAAWIRQVPDLTFAMRNYGVRELQQMIEKGHGPDWQALKQRMDAYRHEFGFRCINELKLEEISIKDDPAFIIQALKNYLMPDDAISQDADGEHTKVAKTAEQKVMQACGNNILLRLLAWWLIRNARACVKEREELRFYRTKVFGFVRYLTRAMGANFVRNGQLQKVEDIYLLSIDEVFGLIEQRAVSQDVASGIIPLRQREQAAFHTLDEVPPRLHFYGELRPERMVVVSADDTAAAGMIDDVAGLYKGTPCSSGKVQGRVKVVHDTRDVQLNGEILVTRRTDPGWVPFFPCISGLIVERGSVLSHSAVVAREMGIPAVVGLRGISALLKDGDEVQLDGAAGLVCRR